MLKVSLDDLVGTIALDRYDKRNALSEDLVGRMLRTLDSFADGGIRVVILRAVGTHPIWSAGHDIDELPIAGADPLPYRDPMEVLLRRVRTYPGAVIAMVQGSVWGGACDLVFNCDLVVADESAAFAVTPAKLGVPYSVSGIQYFLSRLPLHIVNELMMTADPISAERALTHGIINRLVPAQDIESVTAELAAVIRSRSAESIRAYKEQARLIVEAVPLTAQQAQYIHQLRLDVYSGRDYAEGVLAFEEKRPPDFG